MAQLNWPEWARELNSEQQGELLKDLTATEVCACGHVDDDHDEDGACTRCGAWICAAYLPIQLR